MTLTEEKKQELIKSFVAKYSTESLLAQYQQELRYLDEVENPIQTYQKERGIDLMQFLDILWESYVIKKNEMPSM